MCYGRKSRYWWTSGPNGAVLAGRWARRLTPWPSIMPAKPRLASSMSMPTAAPRCGTTSAASPRCCSLRAGKWWNSGWALSARVKSKRCSTLTSGSMLFAVIRSGNADEVRALLAGDSELGNARTPEGATPALWAIYTGHADLVPLLLGSRAPDFFEACALGRTERIGELLSSDSALINSHSADGFTALGFACFFKHLDAAKLLLAHGADASPGEGGGSTPLHTVAGHGN